MASVFYRRILCRRLPSLREISSLSTHPYPSDLLQNENLKTKVKISKQEVLLLALSKRSIIRSYSTSDGKNDNKEPKDIQDDTKKLSIFQKFKQMYRDYWYVLLPVHIVTSTVWFGGFYYMAKSGFDIVAILESWNVSEKLVNPLRDSSMGYIAVAYALYKIATPARYTVTLGGTTISINYLKKWGYIKPVPSKERMKEIFQEQKDTLAKSMKVTKEGIKDKKDNLMESIKETTEGIKEKKDHLVKSVSETTKTIADKKCDIKKQISEIKDLKEKT